MQSPAELVEKKTASCALLPRVPSICSLQKKIEPTVLPHLQSSLNMSYGKETHFAETAKGGLVKM